MKIINTNVIRYGKEVRVLEPQQIIDMIPFGRYQIFLAALYFFNFITNSFLCYNYSYLLILPQYKCLNQTTKLFEDCENEFVCQTLNQEQRGELWYVDYQDILSMNNWIDRLSMHCSEGYLIGLFGSMEFIGAAIAALIFPPIADTYGGKYFSYTAMWLTVLVMLTLMIVKNHYIYYAALTLNGVCIGLKQFIFYTHIMEFMGPKTNFISGFSFFFDGGVFTVSPLILYFITRNTQTFVYIGLALSVITIFFSHTFLKIPESIKFNLIKGNFAELNEDIRNIMNFNNTPEDVQRDVMLKLKAYEDQEIAAKQKQITSIRSQLVLGTQVKINKNNQSLFQVLINTKDAVYNLVMINFGWITATFVFFLLDFFVKYLPGNIYVNQLVASMSMFGYLISDPIMYIACPFISRSAQQTNTYVCDDNLMCRCDYKHDNNQEFTDIQKQYTINLIKNCQIEADELNIVQEVLINKVLDYVIQTVGVQESVQLIQNKYSNNQDICQGSYSLFLNIDKYVQNSNEQHDLISCLVKYQTLIKEQLDIALAQFKQFEDRLRNLGSKLRAPNQLQNFSDSLGDLKQVQRKLKTNLCALIIDNLFNRSQLLENILGSGFQLKILQAAISYKPYNIRTIRGTW
ncbi:UNKNOWN [Stylonychia lemnae]|uniref:Organic cation n=1 Tax=Stylonychia lemnae TaxID=5949 RepID=A0A078B2P6_STYLE|nr:UNKNOWN [Stylonychia lemnae]|eukprot:CDW87768.1 UNKNOWN [Stylonychia lemnae]